MLAVLLVWAAIGENASTGIGFFYAIPVAMSTWWFGWRAGLAFSLACMGLYAIGAAIYPIVHFGVALALRAALLLVVVATVAAVRDRIARLEHSEEELEAIRMALTPPSMPKLPGVDVAAAFVPSELGVSGDFYLLTNGPDGSTIAVVGDVVGHGPKAAQLATFIRAQLATFAANSSDPAEILTLANAALLERPGRQKELVSAVCLRFRPDDESLAWAVAGHPPPLRLPGLEALTAAGTTFLLGVRADLELAPAEARLDPKGGVLVYTDGATDLRLEKDRRLGLDGLQGIVAPIVGLPAKPLIAEIENTLLDRAQGTIRDDICVLVLRPE